MKHKHRIVHREMTLMMHPEKRFWSAVFAMQLQKTVFLCHFSLVVVCDPNFRQNKRQRRAEANSEELTTSSFTKKQETKKFLSNSASDV